VTGRTCSALGLALALFACAVDAAPEEPVQTSASPVSEEKPAATPAKVGDVSAIAEKDEPKGDPKSEGSKRGERLGLDLASDAPFEIDARSAEMLEDGKGAESLRFRGDVRLTQGDLKLTCDRLDAFFPEGRSQGRPQKFIASGDVQVVKGDFELRCTRAEFEDNSCVAVCLSSETCQSGKWPEQPARFRRGKDWIEGRELEFNQCTGKMFARCGARLSVAPKSKDEEEQAEAEPAGTDEKPVPAAQATPKPPAGVAP
jgi:hypothetical protein